MSSGGMKIGLKGFSPVLDSVFGMRDGSVKQQASADLSTQLLSAGPLANVLAATSGNVVFFATKAAMDLALDYSAPQAAWVFADPNPANNAVYYFTNGDPGYWSFMLNFPASWIYATVSGGTANEIELSMAGTVSRSTMIFFEVSEDNLGGEVTIAVNDCDPMQARDFRGDPLEAGALAEGALAVFFPVGDGTARFVVDNTATAAVAAAAASAASANTSALAASDSAVASAASANLSERFAIAPEDVETSPGSGHYSAYHWSQKAMDVVLGDIATQLVAASLSTPDSDDLFPFVSSPAGVLRKIGQSDLIAKFIYDGHLATKDSAEELTNKTLTTPVLKLKNSAGAAPTSAAELQADSTKWWLKLGNGTLAKAFAPNVEEFIGEFNLAGLTAIAQTGLSDFEEIILRARLLVSATNGYPAIRLSADNGSTFVSTASCVNIMDGFDEVGSIGGYTTVSSGLWPSFYGVSSAYLCTMQTRLAAFNKASLAKQGESHAMFVRGSNGRWARASVGHVITLPASAAANALQFFNGDGSSFTAGILRIWGVRG